MMSEILKENIRWPIELTDKTKDAILEHSKLLTATKNEVDLFGEPYKGGLFYIVEGLAAVCIESSDTLQTMSGAIGYQDWFGGLSTLTFPIFKVKALELEPLLVLFIEKKHIQALALENLEIYKLLYAIGQQNTPRWLQSLTISQLNRESVIKYFLIELVLRKKNIPGSVKHLNITQQQLSDLVNITRPRVNEVLQNLIKRGVIDVTRGKIFFTDIQALNKEIAALNLVIYTPNISDETIS